MPFFKPESRSFSSKEEQENSLYADYIVRKIISENANVFRCNPSEELPIQLTFPLTSLLVALATKTGLLLKDAKNDPAFFEQLKKFIIENGVPSVRCTQAINNINRGDFNIANLKGIHAALEKLKQRDREVKTEPKATFPPARSSAEVKSRAPVASGTEEKSLLETLNKDGFWDNSKHYFVEDIHRALDGYEGTHGPLTVIDGTIYGWTQTDGDYISLRGRIITAAQDPNNKEILIPLLNGSDHFVFVKINKATDGTITVSLKDSMNGDFVTAPHAESNKFVLQMVAAAVQEACPLSKEKVEISEPYYTGEQGANAKCSYYAIREVASACARLELKNPDDRLPDTKDMKTFEIAMAQKIVKKTVSEGNKQCAVKANFKPAAMTVDPLGNLCTEGVLTDKPLAEDRDKREKYQKAVQYRTRRQFEMKYDTYRHISVLWQILQTYQGRDLKDWLAKTDPEYASKSLSSTSFPISTLIRALALTTDPRSLPKLFQDEELKRRMMASLGIPPEQQASFTMNELASHLQKDITITTYPWRQERFTVDGVFADPMGRINWPMYILRTSAPELKIEEGQMTLKLKLKMPLGKDQSPEVIARQISACVKTEIDEVGCLMQVNTVISSNGEFTLVFTPYLSMNPQKDLLDNLKMLVYNPVTSTGILATSVMDQIQNAERTTFSFSPSPFQPTPTFSSPSPFPPTTTFSSPPPFPPTTTSSSSSSFPPSFTPPKADLASSTRAETGKTERPAFRPRPTSLHLSSHGDEELKPFIPPEPSPSPPASSFGKKPRKTETRRFTFGPVPHPIPAPGIVFTVTQDNKTATGRTQIISNPALVPPTEGKDFLERAKLRKKDQDQGRIQLQGWLEHASTPASLVSTTGVAEPKAPTSLIQVTRVDQVCVKQYYAAEIEEKDIKSNFTGRDLTQCGVIQTHIQPGASTRLELLLPQTQLIKENKSGDNPKGNFNTLLFDFIHRAVQETLEEQGRSKESKDHPENIKITLDQVSSLVLRIPPRQLALIQYCYFMGYTCQLRDGKALKEDQIVELLRKNNMCADKSGPDFQNFKAFIDRPEIMQRSQPVSTPLVSSFTTPPPSPFT